MFLLDGTSQLQDEFMDPQRVGVWSGKNVQSLDVGRTGQMARIGVLDCLSERRLCARTTHSARSGHDRWEGQASEQHQVDKGCMAMMLETNIQ